MAKKKNDDQVPHAVDEFLRILNSRDLWKYVPECFYGPAALFQRGIETERGNELVAELKRIARELESWGPFPVMEGRWSLMHQLAELRSGPTYNVEKMLAAADDLIQGAAISCEPLPDEEDVYRSVLDTYFVNVRHRAKEWRQSHWQLMDFLAPGKDGDKAAIGERTPILLAHANVGKVFVLVVERAFGPPGLICPDYWKLGLLPLGENDNFLKAIHKGINKVSQHYQGQRIRLRWWLEIHPNNHEGWFAELGEDNTSVEVAAACAAMALYADEPADLRPLLDDTVAVSARLTGLSMDSGNTHWAANEEIGAVAYDQQKKNGANDAGLSGVVFAMTHKAMENSPQNGSAVVRPIVECVDNLYEAYDKLLLTSSLIAEHKEKICGDWAQHWEEKPTPAAYVKASKRDI